VIGGVITIRDSAGHISLRLRALPPDALVVEEVDMFAGYRVRGNQENLDIEWPNGGSNSFRGFISDGPAVGLSLS
jgi:hypothetical protein